MLLAEQLVHQRRVRPGPLVLGTASLKIPTSTVDRDRTVSRRTEPSSRTTLMGEQPNPSHLLQREDAVSRHRGAKPDRRYGLLDLISLLSPGELLFVERWQFHIQTTGSLGPAFASAWNVFLTVKLASALTLETRFLFGLSQPLDASVIL